MGYSAYLKQRVVGFVTKYGNDVAAAIADTGLYFPAVVAQKCLESTYGDSKLTVEHNNFGGVKNYGSLPGAGVVRIDTAEYVNGKKIMKNEPFATYPNPKAAFESYVQVLKDPNKKYEAMGVFTAASPEDQILAMAKAGYTTTPPEKYLGAMQGIIDCVRDTYKVGKVESGSPNTSGSAVKSSTAGVGTVGMDFSSAGIAKSIESLRTAFKK